MEYNNEKTIKDILGLLRLIGYDVDTLKGNCLEPGVRLEASTEELENNYRTCEMIEDYLGQVKHLIDEMLEERKYA